MNVGNRFTNGLQISVKKQKRFELILRDLVLKSD